MVRKKGQRSKDSDVGEQNDATFPPLPSEEEEVPPPPSEDEEVPPPPTEDEEVPLPPSEDERIPPPPTEDEEVPPPPSEDERIPPPPSKDEEVPLPPPSDENPLPPPPPPTGPEETTYLTSPSTSGSLIPKNKASNDSGGSLSASEAADVVPELLSRPMSPSVVNSRTGSNQTSQSAFTTAPDTSTLQRIIGTIQDLWVRFIVLLDAVYHRFLDLVGCSQEVKTPEDPNVLIEDDGVIPPPPRYPPPLRAAYSAVFAPINVRGRSPSENSNTSARFDEVTRQLRLESHGVEGSTRTRVSTTSSAPRPSIISREFSRGPSIRAQHFGRLSGVAQRPPLSFMPHAVDDGSTPLPPPPPRSLLQKIDQLMISQTFHVDSNLELFDDEVASIPPPPPDKDFSLSGSFYLPSKTLQERPYVTIALSLACVIMFIVEIAVGGFAPPSVNIMLGPSGETLVEVGAKFGPLIFEAKEYYRLFVPILLHAGVVHLLINLLVFRSLCYPLEKSFGHIRIFLIFLWGGFFGLALSALFAPSSIGIGASGGLFALFGSTWGDLIQNWKMYGDAAVPTLRKLAFMTLFNAVLGLVPYIDNFAHMGGLIFGFFAGLGLFVERTVDRYGRLKKRKNRQILLQLLSIAMMPLLLVSVSVAILQGAPIECEWCTAISCLPVDWWPCGPPSPCIAKAENTYVVWYFNGTVLLDCPLGEDTIRWEEYRNATGEVPYWLDMSYATGAKNYTLEEQIRIANTLCFEECGYDQDN